MPRSPNTHISFDADDLEDCERAVAELRQDICDLHGSAQARRIFVNATLSKRQVKQYKNETLLLMYDFHAKRYGWSIKRCAKYFAETNKQNPREYLYGPSGSTSPETMEKQLRRAIKRLDPGCRRSLENFARKKRDG